MASDRVMAIVPAYNEEKRISPTLAAILPHVDEVCVVDDGSTDKTFKEASMFDVEIIRHSRNRGKGEAIRSGIEYFLSVEETFELAIFIDADGQHDPSHIPDFINYFAGHPEIDVVVASRFGTSQWQDNMPFTRKLSNLLSRFGIWILYNGLVIEDPQNGYRGYRRHALEHLDFETDGYEAETEMIIDSYLKGFDIGTIHIESIYDEEGNESKFSLFMDTWKIPSVMVRLFFQRKPFLLRSKNDKQAFRRSWT